MKKLSVILAIFLSAACFAMSDNARQALTRALKDCEASLKTANLGNDPVAILPIGGAEGAAVTNLLKNVLTVSGLNCVEGKEDPMWDEIMKEITWDMKKDDMLDSETLVKLGRLQAAQIVVYGTVNELSETPSKTFVEITLHATRLATKQHIWGGSFAGRFYNGDELKGIVELDKDIRNLLNECLEQAAKSISSPDYQARLANANTVTVLPLAGDIDKYATGALIGAITRTRLAPKNDGYATLALARSVARDGKLGADCILYGAIRDLSEKRAAESLDTDKLKKVTTSELRAEIQLFLEDAATGNILWSMTLSKEAPRSEESVISAQDRELIQQTVISSSPSIIRWALYVIGGVIVLFIILRFIRAAIISQRLR